MVIWWEHLEVLAVFPEEILEVLGSLVVNTEGKGFEALIKQVLDQKRLLSHQLLGFVVFQRFGQDGVAVVVIQHHH